MLNEVTVLTPNQGAVTYTAGGEIVQVYSRTYASTLTYTDKVFNARRVIRFGTRAIQIEQAARPIRDALRTIYARYEFETPRQSVVTVKDPSKTPVRNYKQEAAEVTKACQILTHLGFEHLYSVMHDGGATGDFGMFYRHPDGRSIWLNFKTRQTVLDLGTRNGINS